MAMSGRSAELRGLAASVRRGTIVPARLTVAVGAFALASAACSGNSPGGEAAETRREAPLDSAGVMRLDSAAAIARCEPPQGDLPADVTALALRGDYRLTIEVRRGGRTGVRAVGELRLEPYDEKAPTAGLAAPPVLYGWTTVDVAALGAADTGDPASRDPRAPGVLGFEHAAGDDRAITLRLGSKANRLDRPDRLVIEGAYTALRVRGVGEGGFNGTWESGPSPSAGGHFCAERL